MVTKDAHDHTPFLSIRGLTKYFGSVQVLRRVDLDLGAGEIHAICGENGAGKSTLAKIVAGAVRPSGGTIHINGEQVEITGPLDAQRRGIALLHQEPLSFPDLSVAENLEFGRDLNRAFRRVRWRNLISDARRWMSLLGADIDVTLPLRGMSIADQQLVEIACSLASNSRLLLMDEPTAALTPVEAERLFGIMRRLKEEGRALVFVSHRLEEVRAICDRITVLRDGETVAASAVSQRTDAEIVGLMIGRPIKEYLHRDRSSIGDQILSVKGLTVPGRIRGVSFELYRGEIVGLAGLVGAGRTDVARALFGLSPSVSGQICVDKSAVNIDSTVDAMSHGMALVPEDRATSGIFRSLSVSKNFAAAIPEQIAPHRFLNQRIERQLAAEAISQFAIRCAGSRQPIEELSGGNQQKVILARWLSTDPKILILDEPTRGVDVGVKAEFYHLISLLAAAGSAILLISSELPELLALSDRILVMCEGEITATFLREDATQEAIMHAAIPRRKDLLSSRTET